MDSVVADTNILVSSIFWSGKPYEIIQKGINQEIFIFISKEIIGELRTALKRDFGLEDQELEDILDAVILFTHLVEATEKMDAIKEDNKDNIVLECAVAANASYIISGDSHLLKLKEFRGIKIVSANDFLEKNKS